MRLAIRPQPFFQPQLLHLPQQLVVALPYQVPVKIQMVHDLVYDFSFVPRLILARSLRWALSRRHESRDPIRSGTWVLLCPGQCDEFIWKSAEAVR
jgi:hypothetical protein